MKKMIIALSILMVLAVGIVGFAQSDYSSRAGWSLAKSPQGTAANIHKRQGILVGHYVYSVDGALTTNEQLVIKEGIGDVTMPDNAIISSNTLGGWIDITTAADPTSCTGAIYLGSTLIYTGGLGTAGINPIQISSDTKLTADSTLRIVSSANVPTNALSLSVYVPYVLGN